MVRLSAKTRTGVADLDREHPAALLTAGEATQSVALGTGSLQCRCAAAAWPGRSSAAVTTLPTYPVLPEQQHREEPLGFQLQT